MEDIASYLQSKDIDVKGTGNEIHILCPFHEEEEDKPGRCYIHVADDEAHGAWHCLAGDTRVITDQGVFAIEELCGKEPKLLVQNPKNRLSFWRNAPIHYFGEQKLLEVTLRRNRIRKTIQATPEHRWFVRSGRDLKSKREVLTSDLISGHRMVSNFEKSPFASGCHLGHHGICRGFVFGDGTRLTGKGSVAYFHGAKDESLLPFFPDQQTGRYGPRLVMSDFPTFYKTEIPSIEESKPYLLGWLAGYFAADGNFTETADTPTLASSVRSNLERVREICYVLGIGTYGIKEQERLGYGETSSKIYAMAFDVSSLHEDFFLIPAHKERYLSRKSAYVRMGWTVESVLDKGTVAPVYCAVVEGVGNFTLEDNLLTGNCFVCGEKGGLNRLRKHFGDPPLGNANPTSAHNELEDDTYFGILESATEYYHQCLSEQPDVYRYLREERGLTMQTIRNFRLGWADGNLVTHLVQQGYVVTDIVKSGLVNEDGSDFLHDRITIPYETMGMVTIIRGRIFGAQAKAKYLQPANVKIGLYNASAIHESNDARLIIAEGEFDAMVLTQLGFRAVAVPGANTWNDSWTELVKDIKRIFIVYDNDTAGRAGAEKVTQKIGARSRIVEMPEALPGAKKIDVSEWFVSYDKNKDDFDYLFSQATGSLLVTPRQAYEKWQEVEANQKTRIRLNLPELDRQMEYGLGPGQLWVTTAATGSGKTLGSLNLFERMKQMKPDIKILYISMEQGRNEWFESAHRIHKFYEPKAEPLDTVEYWTNTLTVVDKNRLTAEQLQAAIEQFKYDVSPELHLVCVDYLGYFARSYPGEDYAKTTSAIMDLKRIAREEEIVMYTPSQVGRKGERGESHGAGQGKGSGAIEETADLEISFWNKDQAKEMEQKDHTGVVGMKIEKSRNGGLHAVQEMIFSPLSRALVPVGDMQWKEKIERERTLALNGVTWAEATEMHITGDYTMTNFGSNFTHANTD